MTPEAPEKRGNAASDSRPASEGPVRSVLLVRICALVAVAIGLAALLGWGLDLPFLTSLEPGRIPMAPSAAVLFMLYGATILLRTYNPGRDAYRIVFSIHAAGVVIALLLTGLSFQGIHLEVEHIGFSILHAADKTLVGHMSPVTADCFLLASLSFLASLSSSSARPWRANAAWLLASLLLTISYLLVLAYLFGTPLLYGSSLIPPALPTSLAVAALGIALLALAWPLAWQSLRKSGPDIRTPYLLVVGFVIMSAGIMAAGYIFYRHYETNYRIEVEQQLTAIAELKAAELRKWRSDRLGDAAVIYKNATFSRLAQRYFRNPGDREAEQQLQEWMGHYPTQYEYDQVRLLNPEGATLMSFPPGRPQASAAVKKSVVEVLQSGRVEIVDFYRHDHDQKIYLSVLIPVSDAAAASRVVGVVSLRIDPEKYLYPFILRWPSSSKTGETLLTRREGDSVLYLNELKFRKHSALDFRVPLRRTDFPAVRAVQGQTGIVEGFDYRDEHVIAYVRSVPDSPWFLITQMEVSEVYTLAKEHLWIIVGFAIALLFGAGAGLAFFWRQQSMGFYQERHMATEILRESEMRYRALFENSRDGFVVVDMLGHFIDANDAYCNMLGYSLDALRTMEDFHRITPEKWRDWERKEIWDNRLLKTGRSGIYEKEYIRKNAEEFPVELNAFVVYGQEGRPAFLWGIARDISERKKAEEALKLNEDRLETLLKLTLMKAGSEKEITDFALEEAVRLTRSKGGYLHFFNEDEQTIQLYSWSKEVLKICTAVKDEHYPLDKAGIWADSVRLRKPVIHNDYQNQAEKKGCPEGHFLLVRHLGVPIIDKERIVGAMGVGNKEEAYREIDAVQINLFMNSMWRILKQRRNEEEREKLILELQEALANVKTLSGMLPICASCKKIRDDKGYWSGVETFISRHTDTMFSHGICPDCEKKMYEELDELKKNI